MRRAGTQHKTSIALDLLRLRRLLRWVPVLARSARIDRNDGLCIMMAEMRPCVYVLASKRNGTLYIGVTSNLSGRISEHKQDLIDGFTKRYGVHRLVYVEEHGTMSDAIARETQLKRWRRAWKIALIEVQNPEWRDLYSELTGFQQI